MAVRRFDAVAVIGLVLVVAVVLSVVTIARRLGDFSDDPADQLPPRGTLVATAVTDDGRHAAGFEVGDDDSLLPRLLVEDDGGWQAVVLPGATQLNDIVRVGRLVVAVGGGRQGAAAWSATAEGRWRPAAAFDAPDWGELTAATALGEAAVAVGSTYGDDDIQPVAVVASAGTWQWQHLPLPTGYDHGQPADVVAAPGGLVAVGSATAGRLTHPMAWTSQDGMTWEPSPMVSATFPERGSARAVASGAGVLVAVGQHGPRPAAWASTDGRSWEPVDIGPTEPGTLLHDVAATADRSFVIGGQVSGPGDRIGATVLRSADAGRSWAPDRSAVADRGSSRITKVAIVDGRVTFLP